MRQEQAKRNSTELYSDNLIAIRVVGRKTVLLVFNVLLKRESERIIHAKRPVMKEHDTEARNDNQIGENLHTKKDHSVELSFSVICNKIMVISTNR